MQKVISFCLYGSKATYIVGMKENIYLAKEHYPDWEVRIYYNSTVSDKYIVEYKELGAKCILCENIGTNKLNWEGMFWRWFPLDDPDVDFWLSRDADSRLSAREAKIVEKWIQSDKTLHSIRDHRCHYGYIMGGLFGINNRLFRERYQFKKVGEIIKDLTGYYKERPYNVDQIFLNDNLWKVLKDDVMAHISNGGRRVYDTDIEIPSVPDFIGKQYRLEDKLVVEQPNIQNIDLKNKVFKIKSLYKESYLDIIDNKIILSNLNNLNTQLWKLDDDRLVNISNGKYLDFDKNRDLIISDNNKNTWELKEGGFIIHKGTNKAVDIKGGLNDLRKEVWLYTPNYSEAQQWKFIDDSNKKIDLNKLNYDNIYTITTSIASEYFVDNIDEIIKNKSNDIYDGIKKRHIGCGYEFNNELEYYNEYKNAKWGYTKKKNGWDCMRHYEIIANGCIPFFEKLEDCPKNILNCFPKELLIEARNKKEIMTNEEYKYYLKKIFKFFKQNLTCEKVAEKFIKQINNNYLNNNLKILFIQCEKQINYMADGLFIGLRRFLKEKIIDYPKLDYLYKYYPNAINKYGNGFTYTCNLDNLNIDRENIEEKINNKFFDYIIYRKVGGDEGEFGDCRKNMMYWSIVEKFYKLNEIIFLYGGDRTIVDTNNNHLLDNLKYHSNKGLCFVREFNTSKSLIKKKSKKLLILNHNYHHKNKKGMEMICEYLNYELIYGNVNDIPEADVIYCPSHPHDVRKYPDKRFVFGPHLSIFPDNKLERIHNQNNCVYIQPSPWARDVWINRGAEKYLPILSFPFPVEIDKFKPDENREKTNVFIMCKHRKPEEGAYIEKYLRDKNISFYTFRYGGYKEEDYLNYLQTCKYGIWVGRHESQGFALQEALSCNVPLLVWSVTNMRQQHGWNGCPDVPGTTIAYWDNQCGEYFYMKEEFEETYNKFLQNLDNYKPRKFILENVSVEKCAENFNKIFLNEKKEPKKDMGMLWCAKENQYIDFPYKKIPQELLNRYTLDGKIPILEWFDDGRKALLNHNWDNIYIKKYRDIFSSDNILKNKSLWKHEPYPYDKAAYNVLISIKKYNIQNKNVAVIGTTIPWIETILLNNNNKVTTVEYNVPKCTVTNLTCIHYDDFVKSNSTYDCIFSYSSIEHSGLGRYGDPLDPDGDIIAMKHIYNKLEKNSYLFWGGPVGKDTLVWNVHRIYGSIRLPILFKGFNDIEWIGFKKENLFNSPLNKKAKQPLVVLKK